MIKQKIPVLTPTGAMALARWARVVSPSTAEALIGGRPLEIPLFYPEKEGSLRIVNLPQMRERATKLPSRIPWVGFWNYWLRKLVTFGDQRVEAFTSSLRYQVREARQRGETALNPENIQIALLWIDIEKNYWGERREPGASKASHIQNATRRVYKNGNEVVVGLGITHLEDFSQEERRRYEIARDKVNKSIKRGDFGIFEAKERFLAELAERTR